MKIISLFKLMVLLIPSIAYTHSDPQAPPGFPNIQRTPGELIAGLIAPNQGRVAIIAYHEGTVFTIPERPDSNPGSDFQVRSWDISTEVNLHNPLEIRQWGETQHPLQAHGYYKNGDYLTLGPNNHFSTALEPWSFRLGVSGNIERAENPDFICIGGRGCQFNPWFSSTFWSYGPVSGNAALLLDGVLPDNVLSSWDHLAQTGVIGFPFIVGNLLIYASDQSRSGVATYDISDPTHPVLLDVLNDGNVGGYWAQLWGGDGKLYVVLSYRRPRTSNGMIVVDVTDPTNISFVADINLPGDESMYAQFQDEFAFTGSHKVDMRSFESVLEFDTDQHWENQYGVGDGIDTSQFLLPIGNLLVTGGVGPDQGMAIWAHQAEPDTRGPSVGYHIPRDGQTNYPTNRLPVTLLIHETLETGTIINGDTFIVQAIGGTPIDGKLTFSFDDILTFTPDQAWSENTTYEVIIPGGGIKDAAGNGIEAYTFNFSTGSAVGGNSAPVINTLTFSEVLVTPSQSVQITAQATDSDGDSIEYRFDFGDGSDKTPWSSNNQTSYSYIDQGHYKVTAQVRDSNNAVSSFSRKFTVLTNLVDNSKNSSQLQCDASSRRIYTINPDNNTLTAINADTSNVIYEINVCQDPCGVALTSSGQLWISCHDSDNLQVRQANNGNLIETIGTGYGSAPMHVIISPDDSVAYVSLQGKGELQKFNTTTRTLLGQVDLGPRPTALAINNDGSHIYVSRLISPRQHAEIWDVNTATMSLSRTLKIRKFGGEINADGTGSGRGVANYLTGLTLSRDGSSLWFNATKANTERGLLFYNDLDQDNTMRNVIGQIDLNDGSVLRSIDIDNSDSASSISKSPLGDYLLVTLQGNNSLVIYDALTITQSAGSGGFVTKLDVGLAPQSSCVDSQTGQTFTKNLTDRTITALATQLLYEQGNISVVGSTIPTVANEQFSAEKLQGKKIFYNAADKRMSAEGYISCASCHLDGGHDGRSWDFTGRGEGMRNTTTLRGRSGTAHGNVHWSANFDEIQDFEHDIRGPFGGTGFLTDEQFAQANTSLGNPKAGMNADLDALANYVESLNEQSIAKSPYRELNGDLTEDAILGKQIFSEENCNSCHTGSQFTDSSLGTALLHNVGTLKTTSGNRLGAELTGIDTPSLLGVWAGAPYLHDGSANTLADVFINAGGEVVQGEDGVLSGGATIDDNDNSVSWQITDDTIKQRKALRFTSTGNAATFTTNNTTGGVGAIALRYSANIGTHILAIRVNGIDYPVTVEDTNNTPSFTTNMWEYVRVKGIQFAPGQNSITITNTNVRRMSIDEILISLPEDLAAAQVHRRVLSRTIADQNALKQYLLQLDGKTLSDNAPDLIFANGFE